MDRTALAAFLRSRRDTLRPQDLGLPVSPRRRVKGLRREEVAQIAVMSVDYYSRLERGSGTQPSTAMLDVLARALRMSLDERDHLYRLAGHNVPDRLLSSPHVAPGLQRVLGSLSHTPAFIVSDIGITLSQNTLAAALFGDHNRHHGEEASAIYRWFMQPETERILYSGEDQQRQGRAFVSALRIAAARHGKHSPAAKLTHRLHQHSSEFAEIWKRHEVTRRFEDRKIIMHPEIGTIRFDCSALFTEDQTQTLVVLTTTPRSHDAEQLQLLSVVGQHRFSSTA
ncbi:helix-turn-helix domain-containing protein [Nesterenkonia muleiensis]|uniref:helix-turn-helix domain-containing protein n=1 Tax=Nesterenkonia muleiensis TaxID=2282648 RepID=UPI000E732B21|nr:helix-turn-helix transcriptional regulator [Nesterenkonia muleiensis]